MTPSEATTGFGSAIIAQVLWAIFGAMSSDPLIGNIQVLYPLFVLQEVFFSGYILLRYQAFIRWDLFFLIAPAITCAVPIGTVSLVIRITSYFHSVETICNFSLLTNFFSTLLNREPYPNDTASKVTRGIYRCLFPLFR